MRVKGADLCILNLGDTSAATGRLMFTVIGAIACFERESIPFHERVRAGFLALAAAEPDRFCVLDAAQPIERVRARVIAETERRLGVGP